MLGVLKLRPAALDRFVILNNFLEFEIFLETFLYQFLPVLPLGHLILAALNRVVLSIDRGNVLEQTTTGVTVRQNSQVFARP